MMSRAHFKAGQALAPRGSYRPSHRPTASTSTGSRCRQSERRSLRTCGSWRERSSAAAIHASTGLGRGRMREQGARMGSGRGNAAAAGGLREAVDTGALATALRRTSRRRIRAALVRTLLRVRSMRRPSRRDQSGRARCRPARRNAPGADASLHRGLAVPFGGAGAAYAYARLASMTGRAR
jgi:hypothetical protein